MTGGDGTASGALVLDRGEHPISRKAISENALKVLYRLHRSGFLAYMVGGAVRDLILGRRPKDFDIGTNARPQQVRQLFRNARLIGRRFRLARVAFGPEVVEVATFRRSPEPPEMEDGETADVLAEAPDVDEYGTPHEDAMRRDFTVNGLFYNIADFTVIDYVGGLADLRAGVIRTIGAPRIRFGEDPVRMMRAVEYAARLDFRLDEPLVEALGAMHGEIRRAAPARIGYELGESLRSGQALPIFRGLGGAGLLHHIMPEAEAGTKGSEPLLWTLLGLADEKHRRGQQLREESLFTALFVPLALPWLKPAAVRGGDDGWERAIRDLVEPGALRLALSHFRAHLVRHALFITRRLLQPPRSTKHALRTMRHEAFPIAWETAGLIVAATGQWYEGLGRWHELRARVAAGLPAEREPEPGGSRRPRRRRRGSRRSGKKGGVGDAA